MRINFLLIFALVFIFSACNESGGEKAVEEVTDGNALSNQQIIRNPATAKITVDTNNMAVLSFEEKLFQFEEVESGTVVEHDFSFSNTGTVPLLITHARSTCGCTVPQWPKEPILPGEGGIISVKFDTKHRKGNQKKPVSVTANTYPSVTTVSIMGYVRPKEKK